MGVTNRRTRVAALLPELGIEAFLVTRLPNVRYLSGFTGSNAQLLITREAALFLTDTRYEEQARREAADLERRTYSGEFPAAIARTCREVGARRIGFEAAGVSYKTYDRLSASDGLELVPVLDAVERHRWVKEPEELRLIERAQEIADEALERLLGKLTAGMSERETAIELEGSMRVLGADGIGFDAIVAFGENAAEPHHRPKDRQLSPGDVVKLDFGCMVEGYHSDMTRTVAFGEPKPELREIHGVVARAQRAGIEALRPGVGSGAVDEAAREVVREAGYGERFGHSLGHGVGLEVHEGPALRAGTTDVIPEGAVVTVEPGIYVPGLGGVRIEDMVVVTSDGVRPLPRSPRDLRVLPEA